MKAKWEVFAINMMGINKNIIMKKQLLDIKNKVKSNFYNDLLTSCFNVINNNIRSNSDLLQENVLDLSIIPH